MYKTTAISSVQQTFPCRRIKRSKILSQFRFNRSYGNDLRASFLTSLLQTRNVGTSTRPKRPQQRQEQHNTLEEFLIYTKHTSLSSESTTYQGTLYEYLAQRHLNTHLNFTLTRVGGRNDLGIDLLGSWHLHRNLSTQVSRHHPPGPKSILEVNASQNHRSHQSQGPIPILVQCKRVSRATPTLIRELEGAFLAAPAAYRQSDPSTLGILVCTQPATKGIRDAMGRSRRGLAWVMMELVENDNSQSRTVPGADVAHGKSTTEWPKTKIRQFLWNRAASDLCGLSGVDVGLTHADGHPDNAEIQLLWRGVPVNFRPTD